MLFGWKSARHMKSGLGRRVYAEALEFYEEYLDAMYGSGDEDEDEGGDGAPFDSEVIRGGIVQGN